MSTDQGPYQTTWESLQQHPVPQWFDDAKFGIYFHWGPYSVPAYDNEWYSRNMYIPGHKANEHHLATHGELSEFGYKDFIPMFTAEHFDAQEWKDLFQKAGGAFVGPVTEHADGYSMVDSQVNPFNAAQTGPKRDIVAEMEKAVRARGLNFIASLHHMWLWAWYPTTDRATDASDLAYASLYGPPTQRDDFEDPKPDDAFCDTFVDKIKEVIDRYQPDLLYFDARLDTISERHRQDFVAYYYNKAAEWGREVTVTYKNEDLPEGAGIFDLERGRMSGLRDFKWLSDDSICWDSWADLSEPSFKSVKRLIDGLVDIVSKNGNLLLNIPPTADGRIPDPIRERLLGMGAWLNVNGEAIYDTRPWQIYGEGPTEVFEGHFSEKDNPDLAGSDIRFTTKPDALYAIVMGWPEGALHIASLTPDALPAERIASVEFLGQDGAVEWSQDESGLTVSLPQMPFDDHAYSFKISSA